MIPYINILSKKYRCIAPCLRGYGYSSYNTPIKSLNDLTSDLIELVQSHLKINKIFVIGHSNGCALTVELAHLKPQLVYGTILVSPPPPTGWKIKGE